MYNWSSKLIYYSISTFFSSLALGEVFGCILLIPLSRRVGRVRGIAITNTILLLWLSSLHSKYQHHLPTFFSIPLFVLSKNSLFELFVIGRFIAGIAIGIVMGLQALFLKVWKNVCAKRHFGAGNRFRRICGHDKHVRGVDARSWRQLSGSFRYQADIW